MTTLINRIFRKFGYIKKKKVLCLADSILYEDLTIKKEPKQRVPIVETCDSLARFCEAIKRG